jgi:hypothetical protein
MDETTALLQKLQNGEITLEECNKLIRAKETPKSAITYKLSTKGCISFYGLRRMPISLYPKELEDILKTITDQVTYNQAFTEFLVTNFGSDSGAAH